MESTPTSNVECEVERKVKCDVKCDVECDVEYDTGGADSSIPVYNVIRLPFGSRRILGRSLSRCFFFRVVFLIGRRRLSGLALRGLR